MYVAYSEKIIVSNGLDILITTAPRAYQHPKLPACYYFQNHKSTYKTRIYMNKLFCHFL